MTSAAEQRLSAVPAPGSHPETPDAGNPWFGGFSRGDRPKGMSRAEWRHRERMARIAAAPSSQARLTAAYDVLRACLSEAPLREAESTRQIVVDQLLDAVEELAGGGGRG